MIALKESSFLFKSILIFVSVERSALNGKAIYDSDSILYSRRKHSFRLVEQKLFPSFQISIRIWIPRLLRSRKRFPGQTFSECCDFRERQFCGMSSFLSLSQLQMKEEISREFCDNEWDYQVSWLTFNRYGGGARKCKLYELFQFEKAVEILEKRIFMQSTVTNVRCYLNNATF